MNVSDSERVATKLESEGFEIASSEAAADVVLLNTCSIREKAEHKLYTRIGQLRKASAGEKPVIGILGCVAQLEGETLFKPDSGIDFVIGTKAIGRVGAAIDKVYDGARFFADLGDRPPEDEYDLHVSDRQRHSAFVGFVPVIEGCNKFCTYCIVPFSRGREKSIEAFRIIEQIHKLREQGVREVHLIGQNVNSYRPHGAGGLEGFAGATPFSRLLRAAAATGIERVKFNTSFPRDFHPDIIDAVEEFENLCNWVHLPVQSGSDAVLKSMRRGHNIDSYLARVDKIKASPRNISLTTDIIVGFPGETEENFSDTLKMAERCRFDAAYVFKYSPRPGTPAFDMPDSVPEQVKTERFQRLEPVIRASQQAALQQHLGREIEVLAEKVSARNGAQLSGHTSCHKIVNFFGAEDLLGKIITVKITECKSNTLFGEIL